MAKRNKTIHFANWKYSYRLFAALCDQYRINFTIGKNKYGPILSYNPHKVTCTKCKKKKAYKKALNDWSDLHYPLFKDLET